MPSKFKLTAIAVICAVLAAGILFWGMTRHHWPQALGGAGAADQTALAELSTTSTQGLPSEASSSHTISLPIVVYHIVRPSYPSDSAKVRALAITPEVFDAQMQYLGTAGYTIINFKDVEDYFQNGTPLPAHPIILSFDDGWSDQFEYAFPILQKYHYAATFFVFTNSIGRPGFLSWDNLQALLASGMTIGSHSVSHPYLTRITDPEKLSNEISGSKSILESKLGITVNEFAYPFGLYDPAIAAMVQKAGYRSARGDYLSGQQSADRIYELSALNAATTMKGFERQFPQR